MIRKIRPGLTIRFGVVGFARRSHDTHVLHHSETVDVSRLPHIVFTGSARDRASSWCAQELSIVLIPSTFAGEDSTSCIRRVSADIRTCAFAYCFHHSVRQLRHIWKGFIPVVVLKTGPA